MKRPKDIPFEEYCELRKQRNRERKIERAGIYISGPRRGQSAFISGHEAKALRAASLLASVQVAARNRRGKSSQRIMNRRAG